MKLPKIFNKFKENPEEVMFYFEFKGSDVKYNDNISDKIHTKSKYYHEVWCTGYMFDGSKKSGVLSISDIAIYVGPTYKGTNIRPLESVIKQRNVNGDYTSGRYPLIYTEYDEVKGFAVSLKEIMESCTDIHMETDHKDGKCVTKYIFHCTDNENDFDFYLVLYSTSVSDKIKKYLLNPCWVK